MRGRKLYGIIRKRKSERKNITKLKFILLELLSYHFNLTDLTGSDLVHVPKSPHSRDGLNPFPGCCCFSSVIITNIVHGFLQLCHNSITFYTLSYKIQVPIVRKEEGKRSLVCLSMYHVCRNQFNCWYWIQILLGSAIYWFVSLVSQIQWERMFLHDFSLFTPWFPSGWHENFSLFTPLVHTTTVLELSSTVPTKLFFSSPFRFPFCFQ